MDWKREAKAVEKEIIRFRRDFHAHPELPTEEVRTSGVVEKQLKKLGIKTRRMAGTGIAGYLDVPGARRTVALRADMDALPLREESRLPYAFKGNVMHACGHDCHTAILLGVARILSKKRDELAGNVRFIFQPSEEFPPGGARPMVKEGVMRGVDEVYGLHVLTSTPSGKIVADAGTIMANVDDLKVKITGRGAHGASPQQSVDPVLTSAEAIVSLQQIVSRNVNPVEPSVISICIVNAGTAYNIIPETASFRGTIRTMSKSLRNRMPRMIKRVVGGVCKAHGATFEMTYEHGYDATTNRKRETGIVRKAAVELFGKGVLATVGPEMGAEDFSEYLKVAPGCFFFLGVGDKAKGTDRPHHSPHFKVDESVLWRGAAMLAKLAWDGTGSG